MTRTLYRSLLWLHPPSFRRQFAGEMLWIFDEATAAEGPARLLFDGIASLARQWMVRCGVWKVFAGMLGALLQILPLAYLSHTRSDPARALPVPRTLDYYDLEFSRALALLILLLVCGVGFRACLSFNRRRS
ncbi:hypothetical protein SBA6_80032 [Candidatus Sulfopaludibacter sp. SbA6]|nr:hypothetical protein SBA6_80032 [Candidatus Sulfopaludibacter sp. SbA6]